MPRATAVTALVAATVVATPGLANAGSQDRVTGRGVIALAQYEARVNAHSGADGENPRGSFSVDFVEAARTDWKVQVSCLVVVGNTTIVGGLDRTGRATFLTVRDNGETGDEVSFTVAADHGKAPDQPRCAQVLNGAFLLPVVEGDFTVVDA